MNRLIVLNVLLTSALSSLTIVNSTLLSGPVDTVATVGDTVQLNCSSNLPTTVKWILGLPTSSDARSIFVPTGDGKGTIHAHFVERFSFVRDEYGFQNLVIKNVNLSDAGIYTCIDDEGFGYHPARPSNGRWASASLVVNNTRERLSNDSVKAPFSFEPDEITRSEVVIVCVSISFIVILICISGVFLKCREGRKTTNLLSRNTIENPPMEHQTLIDKPFWERPRLHRVISEEGYIAGLAVLNSELFVIRNRAQQVYVYSTDNFTLKQTITIDVASSLWAMAASSLYNRLYISDTNLNVIHTYNLSKNASTKLIKNVHVLGLSLTAAHNILATLFDTHKIKEYTPDGKVLRTINLTNVMAPEHCVQLSNDRYVVSHGGNNHLHRVCIINKKGNIIKSYGEGEGSGDGLFNRPRHLAVDEHGNVLVADYGNNRIAVLNEVKILGYISVPNHLQLNHPWDIHLDAQNNRLYIGEETIKGHVYVLTAA